MPATIEQKASLHKPFKQPLNLGIKVVYTNDDTIDVGVDLCLGDVLLGDLFAGTVQQDLQPLDFAKRIAQDRPNKGKASGKKHIPEVVGCHIYYIFMPKHHG